MRYYHVGHFTSESSDHYLVIGIGGEEPWGANPELWLEFIWEQVPEECMSVEQMAAEGYEPYELPGLGGYSFLSYNSEVVLPIRVEAYQGSETGYQQLYQRLGLELDGWRYTSATWRKGDMVYSLDPADKWIRLGLADAKYHEEQGWPSPTPHNKEPEAP